MHLPRPLILLSTLTLCSAQAEYVVKCIRADSSPSDLDASRAAAWLRDTEIVWCSQDNPTGTSSHLLVLSTQSLY